jgi:hypothetical protein
MRRTLRSYRHFGPIGPAARVEDGPMETTATGPWGHRANHRPRLARAVLLAAMLVIASVGGVSAGRSTSVDPALMTPALNPAFTWECWSAGDRIVCDGELTESYLVDAFPCEAGPMWIRGTDSRHVRRVSDSDGRALRSLLTVQIRDELSLSRSFEGIVAKGRAQFSVAFDYVIPGDLSSRISVLRGADAIVTIPGQGLVLHDVGVKAYDFADNLLFAHGQHPIVDDFEAAVGRVCDALAGG